MRHLLPFTLVLLACCLGAGSRAAATQQDSLDPKQLEQFVDEYVAAAMAISDTTLMTTNIALGCSIGAIPPVS